MKPPPSSPSVFDRVFAILWRTFVVTLLLMLARGAIYESSGKVVGTLQGPTLRTEATPTSSSTDSPFLHDGLPRGPKLPTDIVLTNSGRVWIGDFAKGMGLWVVLAVVLAHFLFVRRRVRKDGGECLCRKCGYILKGLSEPRCPECGEAI